MDSGKDHSAISQCGITVIMENPAMIEFLTKFWRRFALCGYFMYQNFQLTDNYRPTANVPFEMSLTNLPIL